MSAFRLLNSCLLALAVVGTAPAQEAAPLAPDPVVEQRLIRISEELRCLVCQNESLAASRADLAMDLRREIRLRIAKGDSDDAIRAFLVERYGDFILYRPPFKATTLPLWLGPLLLVLAAFFVLIRQLRRRSRPDQNVDTALAEDRALDTDERARLAALLTGEESRK